MRILIHAINTAILPSCFGVWGSKIPVRFNNICFRPATWYSPIWDLCASRPWHGNMPHLTKTHCIEVAYGWPKIDVSVQNPLSATKTLVHPWDKFHWMFVVCRFQRFSAVFSQKKGSHHPSNYIIQLKSKTSKTFTLRRLRKLVGRPPPPTLRAIASVRHRTFPRLPTNRHLKKSQVVSWIFFTVWVGGETVFRGFTCFMGKPTPPKTKKNIGNPHGKPNRPGPPTWK